MWSLNTVYLRRRGGEPAHSVPRGFPHRTHAADYSPLLQADALRPHACEATRDESAWSHAGWPPASADSHSRTCLRGNELLQVSDGVVRVALDAHLLAQAIVADHLNHPRAANGAAGACGGGQCDACGGRAGCPLAAADEPAARGAELPRVARRSAARPAAVQAPRALTAADRERAKPHRPRVWGPHHLPPASSPAPPPLRITRCYCADVTGLPPTRHTVARSLGTRVWGPALCWVSTVRAQASPSFHLNKSRLPGPCSAALPCCDAAAVRNGSAAATHHLPFRTTR